MNDTSFSTKQLIQMMILTTQGGRRSRWIHDDPATLERRKEELQLHTQEKENTIKCKQPRSKVTLHTAQVSREHTALLKGEKMPLTGLQFTGKKRTTLLF